MANNIEGRNQGDDAIRARGYLERYEGSQDVEDLDRAIRMGEEGLAGVLPADDDDDDDDDRGWERVDGLATLAVAYRLRFQRGGDREDLSRAIRNGEEALRVIRWGGEEGGREGGGGGGGDTKRGRGRGRALNALACSLWLRYKQVGDFKDLERGIECVEEALKSICIREEGEVAGDEEGKDEEKEGKRADHAGWLNNLSCFLRFRFEKTHDLGDLKMAIRRGREAVQTIPSTHPDRGRWLVNLGHSHWRLFKETGELGDLDRTVQWQEEAVEATPTTHPGRADRLWDLALYTEARFGATVDMKDLEKVIGRRREAIDATPHDHHARAGRLHDLANSYWTRFTKEYCIDDLQNAIQCLTEAVKSAPADHHDKGIMIALLVGFLREKFRQTEDMEDLRLSIQTGEEGCEGLSPDSETRGACLCALGIAYRVLFEATGNLEYMELAVKKGEEALLATDVEESGIWIDCLNAVAISYRGRFERTGDLGDLKMAVRKWEEALEMVPFPGREELRNEMRVNLEKAKANAKANAKAKAKAVEMEGAEKLDEARELHRLADLCLQDYEKTEDLKDLQKTIRHIEEAVKVTREEDTSSKAQRLATLSIALMARFAQLHDPNDLSLSIRSGEEALQLLPPDNQRNPNVRVTLATCFWIRYQLAKNLQDLEMGIKRGKEALEMTPEGHPDRPSTLHTLATCLESRFERKGDMEDLDTAVRMARESLELTAKDDNQRVVRVRMLAIHLKARYKRRKDPEDLEMAIGGIEDVLECQWTERDKAGLMSSLASLLLLRFTRTEKEEDRRAAVKRAREGVKMTTGDDVELVERRHILASALATRRRIEDLETAIRIEEKVVEKTPLEDRDREARVYTLANFYNLRFELTGDVEDLDKAVKMGEEARECTSTNSRAVASKILAGFLRKRFEQTGNELDLLMAIDYGEEAMRMTRDRKDVERAGILFDLAISQSVRFKEKGEVRDLDLSIKGNEEAVALTPEHDPDRLDMMQRLTIFLLMRFERTRDVENLEMAVRKGQEVIEATPLNHSRRADRLHTLAVSLLSRFEQSKDTEDLQRAVESCKECVALTPEGHIDRDDRLDTLAEGLGSVFQQTKDFRHLDRAIRIRKDILETTPRGHSKRGPRLHSLALTLHTKFRSERFGNLDDLQMAIDLDGEALTSAPSEDKADILTSLAVSLRSRFERNKDLEDLNMAIDQGTQAVAMRSHGHDHGPHHNDGGRAIMLHHLSASYQSRFDRKGDLVDLEMAIKTGQEALETAPREHADRVLLLNHFSSCLWKRFEQTKDLQDSQVAIQKAEEAALEAPRGHPQRGSILNTLTLARLARFEQTWHIEDLHSAIQTCEESLNAQTDDNPYRSHTLANLASCLRARFRRTSNLDDLQASMQKCEEALNSTTANSPGRAAILHNLADSHRARFSRTGDSQDLEKAIDRGEDAVKATPRDHVNRTALLSHLAISYRERFRRFGDLKDLEMAVEKGEEAVHGMLPGDPDQSPILDGLAISYSERFTQLRQLDDLERAVMRGQESVDSLPVDHPRRASSLCCLSAFLYERAQQKGDVRDLEMAIEKGEEALRMTPGNHPHRAEMLHNLALFFQSKSQLADNAKDERKAASLWKKAVELDVASPQQKLRAAIAATERFVNLKEWREAAHITELAVGLLPTVAPRQLRQRDQQHMLEAFSGLATLAASLALQDGRCPSHAVQLLEQGRNVITGLRLGTRSDLSELREKHGQLAERFEELRDVLDSPRSILAVEESSAKEDSVNTANQRHEASREFDRVIAQIRNLSGFERFLLPPDLNDLKTAASKGPVVIINVTKIRCDALIVTSESIRSIPLPDLHYTRIEENAQLLRTADTQHVFTWLWNVVVHPILDHLHFLNPSVTGNLPRIWWIPTGPLTLFPLHAASSSSQLSPECALDRVISSYTSSIKSLLYTRRNARKSPSFTSGASGASGEVLLVSMATTPGYSSLRYAQREIEHLSMILPSSVGKVVLEQPSRNDVLEKLNTCSVFHFAGHGMSNPSDPSRSSLLLGKPSDDIADPLTVSDLIGLDLSHKSPWLAYLSACSTAETTAGNLYDEALNLASVCQIAGFQHVIGSLWEVSDEYSVYAAGELYKTILEAGGVSDDETVARGLNRAARILRNYTNRRAQMRKATLAWPRDSAKVERSDLVWAAYIHVGP